MRSDIVYTILSMMGGIYALADPALVTEVILSEGSESGSAKLRTRRLGFF